MDEGTTSDVKHRCCDAFEKAKQAGTDNEGWAELLYVDYEDGKTKIGSELPPIQFCPWCGAKITDT